MVLRKTDWSLVRNARVVLGYIIDISSFSYYVAVPLDCDEQPVRELASFTEDLVRLADSISKSTTPNYL